MIINVPILVIFLFWLFTWMTLMFEYFDALRSATAGSRLAASLVLLVGAPFFLVSNVLTLILDQFLPSGWNDDDDDKGEFK